MLVTPRYRTTSYLGVWQDGVSEIRTWLSVSPVYLYGVDQERS
jgi:hypothetical protein